MRRVFLVLLASVFAHAVGAAAPAYDETANARQVIANGIAQAQATGKPLLLVFGANWCGDCLRLNQAFQSGKTAELVAQTFTTVKVDVGNFDKNLDIAQQYGVPLRKGIPTIAVLSPKGEVRYSTQAGELADARKMGDDGLLAFFKRLASDGRL